jgi:hypothetical protein
VDDSRAEELAHYDEILKFLVVHDEYAKLRALAKDIRDLRDRLIEEMKKEH